MEEPSPLSFYVTIDPEIKEINTSVVAWGDFTSEHPDAVIYAPGLALSRFYVDLIMGRPMPLQFVTKALADIETLVAITLFLDRSLALHPKTNGLVAAFNLVTSLGAAGMAHIDRDLGRFILFLDTYLLSQKPSKKEMEQKLSSAIQWVREYVLEGKLPSMPSEQDIPKVVDTGTNGFVLATMEPKSSVSLILSVVELYRLGHLRGVIFCGNSVLAFKKGKYLQFDLTAAAGVLDLTEKEACPDSAPWFVHPGGLFLASPPKGTAISRESLTELFLRV